MNKDKILEVAQQSKVDERYIHFSAKSTIISLIFTIILVLFLMIWRTTHGESVVDYGLIIITLLVAFSINQYIKLPERKIYLFVIVVGIIFFLTNLIIFIASYGVF